MALWIPLIAFLAFVAVVAFGLKRPPETLVQSHLVDKPAPQFSLPGRLDGHAGLATADLRSGKPVLVNFFASWCIPCAVEAPELMELRRKGVTIYGIAIRDTADDVAGFIKRNGNAFDRIGFDDRSQTQMAFGSSGVPESFIVDGKGVIRYQHIGNIQPEQVPMILDQVNKAR